MYTQPNAIPMATNDADTVCGVAPVTGSPGDPASFGELAQSCDSVLGDCLNLADGILQFMSGQNSLPMEKMGEPGCFRDSLLRCHTEVMQLRQVLLLVRKMLG